MHKCLDDAAGACVLNLRAHHGGVGQNALAAHTRSQPQPFATAVIVALAARVPSSSALCF